MDPTCENVALSGRYSSAVRLGQPPHIPPVSNTVPSARSVAVCIARGRFMLPNDLKWQRGRIFMKTDRMNLQRTRLGYTQPCGVTAISKLPL